MTEPFYDDGAVKVFLGDCLDALRALPDASVDAVVCDPPYALTELPTARVLEALTAWLAGDRDYVPDGGRGFMGRRWDRFVPPPAVWDECMRVLKPGGHLLAFAGARTVDLMGLSIRLAGLEIRDSIHWVSGSGFPKSLDVAKAIDKAGGASPAKQAAVLRAARERAGLTREQVAEAVGCTTASVRDWEEGRARAAGRAVEHIVPSAEYRTRLADLLGYSADERLIVGLHTDRRGDGTVIGLGHSGVKYGSPVTEGAVRWSGWGTALKPAHEPIIVARMPLAGTVAENVLAHGTGAINIGATRVGNEARTNHAGGASSLQRVSRVQAGYRKTVTTSVGAATDVTGRWPTNFVLSHPPLVVDGEVVGDACAGGCVEGCPVSELDAQSGTLTSGTGAVKRKSAKGGARSPSIGAESRAEGTPMISYGDSGGASRYFPTFRYEAKAPARERPKLADGTAWPTVKPLGLMRWLIRLVTPPGGLVLDPFAGSGATGEAAVIEGFRALLIDQDPQAAELIKVRLGKPISPVLDFEGEIA